MSEGAPRPGQGSGDELVAALLAELHDKLPPAQAKQAERFARRYFERFPLVELRGRAFGDIAASLFGSWHFLQEFDRNSPKVRLFNPEFERHGWQLSHSVLAILCGTPVFALDSVRAELNRRNIAIHTVHIATFRTRRDAAGRLQEVLLNGGGAEPVGSGQAANQVVQNGALEALLYLEIGRHVEPAAIDELRQTVQEILAEVAVAVADYEPMKARLAAIREQLECPAGDDPELGEVCAFIDWLLADNFTFLGVERIIRRDGAIEPVPPLGLFRVPAGTAFQPAEETVAWEEQALVALSKAPNRTRVHRRVYPDYLDFAIRDQHGEIIAEERVLGLYSFNAYSASPQVIPLIRRKVAAVLARAGFPPRSHEYAELRRILEVHPRDELFQSNTDQLFEVVMGIYAIQERRLVRLFVRPDRAGRFVSCLVYMPRDGYRTEVRRRIEQVLCDTIGGEESEFTTFFSESALTRTHFMLRLSAEAARELPAIDRPWLEQQIVEITLSWQDRLRSQLIERFGEAQGDALARHYGEAFPPGYRDDWDARSAVSDIEKLATLQSETDIAMGLYRLPGDPDSELRFRLFHLGEPLPLSDILPILENLGLRVISERPYRIERSTGAIAWIHEFGLQHMLGERLDLDPVRDSCQEAFARIWAGEAENDAFNKLILAAGLDWRGCALIRAYAHYMKQIQFALSGESVADTLVHHAQIAAMLVDLFTARFDPALTDEQQRSDREAALIESIDASLENVASLNQDRVLRQCKSLIEATLRTNFFQPTADGAPKSYIALKFAADQVPHMPLPRPRFEVFIYSPQMEGVHLRASKVARGGIRWSGRHEDFRTEVLGLVKAQQVKNAVIVPSGAKGGFIVKRPPVDATREQLQEQALNCYRLYIQGLLDITDNLVDGAVVPPAHVVRKDDDDTYMVVAADKGTATFSDTANAIAAEYGFWLGDAFASGGSIGYDHKGMGITARGAWISVQRHFRELDVDPEQDPITVIGIGDMSGDVFGNGLLRSRSVKLLAAFNHLHIFIDPDPDPAAAYSERERLFRLPRSSWGDYDAALIAPGGGVFSRNQKAITITPQMRELFGIEATELTPNELITALLKAPVDLLWNGGIGTYVKAASEKHAEVGDKANDAVRVNGGELGARVVGEGGNLGMTQLGRVEYALRGGLCNTDFIDNSGGVDCSDHEVNIKIALNTALAAGDLTEKQRRELLFSMTDTVAELVLDNNYRQALALSLAERQVLTRHGEYRRLIHRMEVAGHLDRQLEFLPDDESLAERRAAGRSFTRPELAILLSYTKTQLQTELIDSTAPDDPLLARALFEAFPAVLCERYQEALESHRLRREIIATHIANDMVDLMGITFIDRIKQSTGASAADIARAYITAREVFAVRDYWQAIAALDGRVPAAVQMDMMLSLMRMTRRATRWFIRNRRLNLDPSQALTQFGEPMTALFRDLPQLLEGRLAADYREAGEALEAQGVPTPLAEFIAATGVLYSGLGIIDAALEMGAPLRRMFAVYQALVLELELDLFARQLAQLKVENHWHALARESFRDDLEWQLRRLAASAIRHACFDGEMESCIERWLERQAPLVARWRELLLELHATESRDIAVYAVAIRELLDLAQASQLHDSGGDNSCDDGAEADG